MNYLSREIRLRAYSAAVILFVCFPTFGQGETTEDPTLLTALITWAPFLFLVGLWIFFMRKGGWFGKGGYREYMRVSQEKLVQIEGHLADIAASLRTIAQRERT